ncbi:MAG: hypothetical protein RPT25_04455 [Cycloclasticus sp.]
MELSSKVIALSMMDAHSKMLEIASANNLSKSSGLKSHLVFDIDRYTSDLKTNGAVGELNSYIQTVEEELAIDEIIMMSHSSKTNYQDVVELYSRYGSLKSIALGVK